MKNSILLALCFCLPAFAYANSSANTLDSLLLKVKAQQSENRSIESQRDTDFSADLSVWQEKLKVAQQRLALAKKDAAEKGAAFESNEQQLVELTEALNINKENLGELFGVVRQVAGDFSGQIQGSVISAQYPERNAFVNQLAQSKTLPSLTELEKLWFVMLQDMTESSKVVPFSTQVLDAQGVAKNEQITRLGGFNLVAGSDSANGSQYLVIDSQSELPQPLSRPVASEVQSTLETWQNKDTRLTPFYFDPAKGELLTVLSRTPTWTERAQQGGIIGYIILSILLFGLVIAAVRFALLTKESAKIKLQLNSETASQDNALGRVMGIYQANKQQTTQLLELKLEEAILCEVPRLERGSSVLKVLAAIAPMMGLLGTVTGMIGTFQSITLFGTGDPKLMAGGISMALITTVLGLIAALPLLLIHSLLHSRANNLINIIEQQSAGLIASQAELHEQTNTATEQKLADRKSA
ncbi:flagellar motor protein MotA [Psychromonas marina]|uniref:Flagellar motor protein MotA n=1 Tax=Psychromonas marina TaxID=88364 RepID=A0ABQ6E0W9_9GAMM|nr:MotA/TolQ/ExbB proton channel family protein [Psychromonas marina]GLS90987.1 flagellar motor protein MotA [Psychromonas marina]